MSLMSLKLSRSRNSTFNGVWLRTERASICSTRSRINVRFGGPVNGSRVEVITRRGGRCHQSRAAWLSLCLAGQYGGRRSCLGGGLGGDREQREAHARTMVGGGEPDLAVVRVDDRACDGQAEAGAVV